MNAGPTASRVHDKMRRGEAKSTSRNAGSRRPKSSPIDSIQGFFLGLAAFCGSFYFLWTNEQSAVTQLRSLEEGRRAIVRIDPQKIDPATEGALVFLSGKADTAEPLVDSLFHVSEHALRYWRQVLMYVWKEETHTDEDTDGHKTTSTSYVKTWAEMAIPTKNFKTPAGHENPLTMPWESERIEAADITIGKHKLSEGLRGQLQGYSEIAISGESLARAPAHPNGLRPLAHNGGLYYGQAPANPQIGDLKVIFRTVAPQDVSIAAAQSGDSFAPYRTRAGNDIELLRPGLLDTRTLFDTAQHESDVQTWLWRAGGWVMMCVGLWLFLDPFVEFIAKVPGIGGVVALGIRIGAFILGTVLTVITIAVCWLAVRPAISGSLIAGALVVFWLAKRRGLKKIAAVAA